MLFLKVVKKESKAPLKLAKMRTPLMMVQRQIFKIMLYDDKLHYFNYQEF